MFSCIFRILKYLLIFPNLVEEKKAVIFHQNWPYNSLTIFFKELQTFLAIPTGYIFKYYKGI
jgi:hypothetical protein